MNRNMIFNLLRFILKVPKIKILIVIIFLLPLFLSLRRYDCGKPLSSSLNGRVAEIPSSWRPPHRLRLRFLPPPSPRPAGTLNGALRSRRHNHRTVQRISKKTSRNTRMRSSNLTLSVINRAKDHRIHHGVADSICC